MAEPFLNRLRVGAQLHEQRDTGVSQVVEAEAFEPGTSRGGFGVPYPQHGPAKRSAVAVGPNEVVTTAALDLFGERLEKRRGDRH